MKHNFIFVLFITLASSLQAQEPIPNDEKIIEIARGELEILERYITIISDVSETSYTVKQDMIDGAMEHFRPGSKIQKSNCRTRQVETLEARTYFEHLADLGHKYDTIRINFLPNSVGEIISTGYNKYKLIGEIKQKFIGYMNGVVKYSDTTFKDVELFLQYNAEFDEWRILIGNISVKFTSKCK